VDWERTRRCNRLASFRLDYSNLNSKLGHLAKKKGERGRKEELMRKKGFMRAVKVAHHEAKRGSLKTPILTVEG